MRSGAQTIMQSHFDAAYRSYSNVPRPLLEALAYSASRMQNIIPEEGDHHAGPLRYGLFALVEDGKGYFANTLLVVCKNHNISPSAFKADIPLQIMAVAHYLSVLCAERQVTTAEQLRPVLDQFSEIPAAGDVTRFAKELSAYEVFYHLNNGIETTNIKTGKLSVNRNAWFKPETYELLKAPKLLIEGSLITDGHNVYKRENITAAAAATDYPPALWVTSPNYSSRNSTAITAVAIHTMQGSYAGSIAWFQNTSSNASAHYMVRSSDGQVTQMVREANKAWHAGTENPYTIGIEHEGYVAQTGWYTSAMYNASVALTKDICTDNNISTAACYNGPSGSTVNVLASTVKIKGHQHFPNQTHTDPGINWDWPLYYNLLNPVTCNASTTLNESFISTAFANLNWNAASGASGYTLEWKSSAATTWNSVSSTINYKTIAGLSASASYNWRVKTNCSNGGTSAWSAIKTFTTKASCWDGNEPNNVYTSPSAYNMSGIFTYGKICASGDIDFYRITTTAAQNITFKLQTLPKNYNIETFTGTGAYLAGGYASGTADETVSLYNKPAGNYLFRVYGAAAADHDALNDYRLQVVLSAPTANRPAEQISSELQSGAGMLSVYPNPASGRMRMEYIAPSSGTAVTEVFDSFNRQIIRQQQTVNAGRQNMQLDCSNWVNGIYYVRITIANTIAVKKIVVSH